MHFVSISEQKMLNRPIWAGSHWVRGQLIALSNGLILVVTSQLSKQLNSSHQKGIEWS